MGHWVSSERAGPAAPGPDPDVVLVHLGTNDMWGGWMPLQTKLTAFTKLIGQMRAANPTMKIIVAKIIPMGQSACATCPADVVAFNNALPAWAAGLTTAQSPIVLADLWTGFDAATDTGDGVHPNTAGYQKMADSWYPVLTQVLDGVTPTTTWPTTTMTTTTRPSTTTTRPSTTTTTTTRPTTTTTRPTTTTTTTRSTTASTTGDTGTCTATYRVISQWPGGFQGEVTVTNGRSTASTGWTASFGYADGQRITQAWNAAVTQTGAAVSAANLSWNGTLAAAGSASFGFLASWNGTANSVPPVTCTVG